MWTFLLGIAVGTVINLVTALFSRRHAIRLIPWFCLYIAIHGSAVILNSHGVKIEAMSIAKKYPPVMTYPIVVVILVVLGCVYWWSVNSAVAKLDSITTTPKIAESESSPAPAGKVELTGEQKRSIVVKLIETYRQNNSGKDPSIGWLNERLQRKGLDFRVALRDVPKPPLAGIIRGGTIRNNAMDGVLNATGRTIIIEGVEISGNQGHGVEIVPPPQAGATKKPPKNKP